jgi:hypothetical protein
MQPLKIKQLTFKQPMGQGILQEQNLKFSQNK